MKNKIYIIHENDEWIEPLRKELNDISAPFEEWHLGKRNVDHLEIIKAYKKVDGTTSIWTSEDFTAIDAAITSGKTKASWSIK